MKSSILYSITIILLVFISCNNTKNNKKPVLHNEWTKDIVLENGAKWKANDETTDGILKMSTIVKNHNNTELAEYKELGIRLKEESNQIIKKCSMKGAAHDNLHTFLVPLLDKIHEFQNVTSIDYGKELHKSVLTHLEAYYTYFE